MENAVDNQTEEKDATVGGRKRIEDVLESLTWSCL